jgi:CheY-like chemotaxis protein
VNVLADVGLQTICNQQPTSPEVKAAIRSNARLLSNVAIANTPVTVASLSAGKNCRIFRKMKRILVVDDEPSVLLGICNILRGRRAEWEAILVLDAEEACQRLDALPDIDVVISDLAMPGGGGEVVLRYAKEKHPRVTRILLSGKVHTESAAAARALAHRFLEKPCPPDVLKENIAWAIANSPA